MEVVFQERERAPCSSNELHLRRGQTVPSCPIIHQRLTLHNKHCFIAGSRTKFSSRLQRVSTIIPMSKTLHSPESWLQRKRRRNDGRERHTLLDITYDDLPQRNKRTQQSIEKRCMHTKALPSSGFYPQNDSVCKQTSGLAGLLARTSSSSSNKLSEQAQDKKLTCLEDEAKDPRYKDPHEVDRIGDFRIDRHGCKQYRRKNSLTLAPNSCGGKREFGGRKTPSTPIELDDSTPPSLANSAFPSENQKMR
jgi:hypothetical protein